MSAPDVTLQVHTCPKCVGSLQLAHRFAAYQEKALASVDEVQPVCFSTLCAVPCLCLTASDHPDCLLTPSHAQLIALSHCTAPAPCPQLFGRSHELMQKPSIMQQQRHVKSAGHIVVYSPHTPCYCVSLALSRNTRPQKMVYMHRLCDSATV